MGDSGSETSMHTSCLLRVQCRTVSVFEFDAGATAGLLRDPGMEILRDDCSSRSARPSTQMGTSRQQPALAVFTASWRI